MTNKSQKSAEKRKNRVGEVSTNLIHLMIKSKQGTFSKNSYLVQVL